MHRSSYAKRWCSQLTHLRDCPGKPLTHLISDGRTGTAELSMFAKRGLMVTRCGRLTAGDSRCGWVSRRRPSDVVARSRRHCESGASRVLLGWAMLLRRGRGHGIFAPDA